MANTVVTLRDGLKIGETKHLDIEIRDVTAGDLIDATAESEKLVQVPGEGSQLVSSPTLVGANMLRRQIVRVGDYKGPLSLAELKLFSAFDFGLINSTIERMESVSLEVGQRGRD